MRILLRLLLGSLFFSFFLSQVEKEWVARETQGAASWLTGDTDAVQQHLRVTGRAVCTLTCVGGVSGPARATIRRLASVSIQSAHVFYALHAVYYESWFPVHHSVIQVKRKARASRRSRSQSRAIFAVEERASQLTRKGGS